MKILLVEDDEGLIAMIGRALYRQGHEFTIVPSGEKSIKNARDGKFDLIIADILMPDVDGIETIQEIRAIDPDIKIIAISDGGRVGFSSFLELVEVVGADVIIDPPLTPIYLIKKIDQVAGNGRR